MCCNAKFLELFSPSSYFNVYLQHAKCSKSKSMDFKAIISLFLVPRLCGTCKAFCIISTRDELTNLCHVQSLQWVPKAGCLGRFPPWCQYIARLFLKIFLELSTFKARKHKIRSDSKTRLDGLRLAFAFFHCQ